MDCAARQNTRDGIIIIVDRTNDNNFFFFLGGGGVKAEAKGNKSDHTDVRMGRAGST